MTINPTTARRLDAAEVARRKRGKDNIAAVLATRAARADLRINTSEEEAAAFETFAARFQGFARVNLVLLWDQCPSATRVNTRQGWPFDANGPRRVRRNTAAYSAWLLHETPEGLRGFEVWDESMTDPA